MRDVLPLLGQSAVFPPFRNSNSNACLPTRRSRAAIRASYCRSRFGGLDFVVERARLVLLNPQRIRFRHMSWSFDRPESVPPAGNFSATWRLSGQKASRHALVASNNFLPARASQRRPVGAVLLKSWNANPLTLAEVGAGFRLAEGHINEILLSQVDNISASSNRRVQVTAVQAHRRTHVTDRSNNGAPDEPAGYRPLRRVQQ